MSEDLEYRLRSESLYDVRRHASVIGWRADNFAAMGFSHLEATALAIRRDVDREAVAKLLARGASPDQARRILT
jgi:hypothetical protein